MPLTLTLSPQGEGKNALFPFLLLNHQTVYKTVTPLDSVINIMTIR